MAVHRKHHAFTDEEGDPHSPKLEGFWKVQLGNVFYYIREVEEHRRRRALRARHQGRLVGSRTCSTAASLGLDDRHRSLLCRRCSGVWLGAAGGRHSRGDVRVRAVVVDQRPVPHVGYKNFDNTATNIRFLALLTGGEGLHNNHHGYPRSPKFSFRASEIDPAWPLIKLLIAAEARRSRTRRSTKQSPKPRSPGPRTGA